MGFRLPDLIIESILRDGMNNARRDETVLDDVFSDLTLSFASKKYGNPEVEKIKKIIRNQEVNIVHAFNLVNSNLPCISIQLADDREDTNKSHMGDFDQHITFPFETPEEVASTLYVDSFQPTGYNPNTGVVTVADSVNLAQIYANLLFVDSAGVEHTILGGIDNEAGSKQFIIGKNEVVALGPSASIKTSIDFNIYERRNNLENTQIMLGIHTKEALLTKYLYILVKYFLLSRKKDMTSRGLQLDTYSGSDFNRNLEYEGDVVYNRFIQLSGILQNTWRSDKVQLVDNIEVTVQVPKDELDNEQLGLTDSTIQVKE